METLTTARSQTRASPSETLLREDGAYVFHHPPKFLWRDGRANTVAWQDFHLYLHVPFCRNICTFCTFERSQLKKGSIPAFLSSLDTEMSLVESADDFSHARLQSVYLGGGTASLLPNDAIVRFIERLAARYTYRSGIETTLECEPQTKSQRDFVALAAHGVNRVSVGVQTFSDRLLPYLDRIHKSHHSLAMIDAVRAAEIDNLHIDLMYGLPGQTFEEWKTAVDRSIELDIDHISTYKLIVFERERLDRSLRDGTVPPRPSKEAIEDMRCYARETYSSHGYERYSLTEFARPGKACRYVTSNWNGSDYLGLGAGAYSRNGDALWENTPLIHEYHRRLNNGEIPVWRGTTMSVEQRMQRDVAMGLCMLEVDLDQIVRDAGPSHPVWKRPTEELEHLGLIQVDDRCLSLTESGIRYATHVMKRFTES